MATPSLAHDARPSTPVSEDPEHVSAVTARVLRGQALYRDHAEGIRFADGVWLVPSQHDATSVYEVVIGRRGESCECRDFEHRGNPCKHIVAATIARAKTATCAGCGGRFKRRALVEIIEEHDTLTGFVGDKLCRECARTHGAL